MTSVKPSPDPRREAPLIALFEAATRVIGTELQRRLAASGFDDQRLSQSRIFGAIPSEGIRLTDLAERLWMTKQAVGEQVDGMERAGYVERRPDPVDARAKLICFTDKGWRAVDAALAIFDDVEAELAGRFGADRVRAVRELLTPMLGSDPFRDPG